VQWVCRPEQSDFRGYAGRIESGSLALGDEIAVFPSGARSRVKSIAIGSAARGRAQAGESILLTLADDVDISRGDLLAGADAPPQALSRLEATVCWLNAAPLEPRREYLLRQGARETRARIAGVPARLDIETLQWQEGAAAAAAPVQANDIVRLEIGTQNPIAGDRYEAFRSIGSFILIDPASNETVAGGMIAAR